MLLHIAGCTLALDSAELLPVALRAFQVAAPYSIDLHISRRPALPDLLPHTRFVADQVWHLRGDDVARQLVVLAADGSPFAVAQSRDDPSRWCIYGGNDVALASLLFDYPIGHVLLTDHLAADHSLMLHACGLLDDGVIALVGPPGAGKSTSARLWHACGAVVLSDDRIIVRRKHGAWWAYGSPWHSSTPHIDPRGAPLRALILIEHGTDNHLAPLDLAIAWRRLLPEIYLPLWNRQAVEQVMAAAADLVACTPCYRLRFQPTAEVVSYVRAMLDPHHH